MRSLILATVLLAGCADTYGTWKGDLTRPEWTTIRFDEKKYTKETLEPVFSGSIAQMRNVFVIVAAPDCEACRLIRDWWSLTGRVPSYASFIYIDAVNASSALKAKALIDVITSANPMPFEYQGGHDSEVKLGAVLQPVCLADCTGLASVQRWYATPVSCNDVRSCTEGVQAFIQRGK